MSFSQASAERGVSRAYTSVHLIGGIDINATDSCKNISPCRLPDLKTEGGAIFCGSVAIYGDMCIGGTLTGNVGGNLSGNLMGDISVEGDFDVGGNLSAMEGIISNLETDVLCVNDELFVDFISPKTGDFIDLGNVIVDDLTINGIISGNLNIDLSNVTSLSVETFNSNIIEANIVCVNGNLLVDFIEPKNGNIITMPDVIINDLTINGTVFGNIEADLSNITNLSAQTINSNIVNANLVDANIVCVNTELQTNLITQKTGNIIQFGATVIPTSNIAFDFGSVTNRWGNVYVDCISTSTISGNSPITVLDDLLPEIDLELNLGIPSQRWRELNVGGINVSGVLQGNVINANVINGGSSGDLNFLGNLTPVTDNTYSIGSNIRKIKEIWVQDIVICGTASGNFQSNGDIDLSNVSNLSLDILTANSLCVNNDVRTDFIVSKTVNGTISVGDDILMDSSNLLTVTNFSVDEINATLGNIISFKNATTNFDGEINTVGNLCISAPSVLLVDTIVSKTQSSPVTIDDDLVVNGNLTLTGNVDFDCADLANINSIEVDIISAKTGTITITDGMTVDGPFTACNMKYCRTEISANVYTILETDDIIAANTQANAICFTLPEISTLTDGLLKVVVVDEGGNASMNFITIKTSGSDTIFGGTEFEICGDYNAVQIYSNGVDSWYLY